MASASVSAASDRDQAHDSEQNVALSDTVELRRAALDELLHLHIACAIDHLLDANAAKPELEHRVRRLQAQTCYCRCDAQRYQHSSWRLGQA